jgi:hypothetical protein
LTDARDIIARARTQGARNGLGIVLADDWSADVLTLAALLEAARDALRSGDPGRCAVALAMLSEAVGGLK